LTQSLILDLRRRGITLREISLSTRIPYGTLVGWLNQQYEPRHRSGEQMILL
jgi:lambda repressor-like predicted transcriptional regulator